MTVRSSVQVNENLDHQKYVIFQRRNTNFVSQNLKTKT